MTADVWLPDNIDSMAVPDHVSSCWKRNQEYRRSLCNEFVIQVTCQFDPLRPNGLGLSCPNQPGATSYMVRTAFAARPCPRLGQIPSPDCAPGWVTKPLVGENWMPSRGRPMRPSRFTSSQDSAFKGRHTRLPLRIPGSGSRCSVKMTSQRCRGAVVKGMRGLLVAVGREGRGSATPSGWMRRCGRKPMHNPG